MAPRRKVAKKAAKKNPLKKHFKGAGRKVMASMKRRYGKRAKRIFYATEKARMTSNPRQRYSGKINTPRGVIYFAPIGGHNWEIEFPDGKRVIRSYPTKKALVAYLTRQYGVRNPSGDETDLMIESTPLAESFCVERLDIHTQETKPIATDLTASEAKTVASALTQNHGEGAFFNVEPERTLDNAGMSNPSDSPLKTIRNIGFTMGKQDANATFPAYSDDSSRKANLAFNVDKLIQYWGAKESQRSKLMEEGERAYWDGRSGKRGRRKRSNPDSQTESERLYKTFHGADPKFVTDVRTELFSYDSYAKLGDLISFTVIGDDGQEYDAATPNPDIASKEDVVSLAASPSGRQLYFIGGDQEINPSAFGIKGHAATKDLICLGRLKALCYRAAKEMHDFELIDYTHKSGENLSPSGKRYLSKDALPYLNYDALNKQLSVAGGAYFITGRGIEN